MDGHYPIVNARGSLTNQTLSYTENRKYHCVETSVRSHYIASGFLTLIVQFINRTHGQAAEESNRCPPTGYIERLSSQIVKMNLFVESVVDMGSVP